MRHPPGLALSYGTSVGTLRRLGGNGAGLTIVGNRFRLMLYPARGVGIGAELRQDGRDFGEPQEMYIVSLTLLGQYHPASVLRATNTYAQVSVGTAADRREGIDGRAVGLAIGGVRPVGHCGPRCRPEVALEWETLRLFPRAHSGDRFSQVSIGGFGGVGRRF